MQYLYLLHKVKLFSIQVSVQLLCPVNLATADCFGKEAAHLSKSTHSRRGKSCLTEKSHLSLIHKSITYWMPSQLV